MFKTGDIILTSKHSLIAKFMSWFQKDPVYWGHVMIAKNNNTAWEATWRYLGETDLVEQSKQRKHWKILRKRDLTDDQAKLMAVKAESLLDQPYSVWRIVLQFFDHVSHTNWFSNYYDKETSQVCSSYAAWLYQEVCGYKFNGVEWQSCEPDDIDDDTLDHPEIWQVINEKNVTMEYMYKVTKRLKEKFHNG